MSSLDQFAEPITVADASIGAEYKAYKMDSSIEGQDMRKTVDLGTCHCCDYFLAKDRSIIFIEETRLLERVRAIREKYNYLNDKDKDEIVNARLRERLQLKAYGSMLVLCRLTAKCPDAETLVKNKKYHFWLVAGSMDSADDKKYFDNLRDSLRGDLMQVLGKTLFDSVDVILPETLKERYLEKRD